MAEFVFGSHSTTEKRADYFQAALQGVKHQYRVEPQAVRPGERPILTVMVELARRIDRVECVVIEPETAVYPLHLVKTEWDLLNWSYYQVWQVTLPPLADGTLVRYRILAYPVDGGDPIPAAYSRIDEYDLAAVDYRLLLEIAEESEDREKAGEYLKLVECDANEP